MRSETFNKYSTKRGVGFRPCLNHIVISAANSSAHELGKTILGLLCINGCDFSVIEDKELKRLVKKLGEKVDSLIIDFGAKKEQFSFITEAVTGGDIIDFVSDDGTEVEIINTHGLEKAINKNRTIFDLR